MKNKIIKKIVDFFVALIALILLSPFFLFIAVLIKLDSRGPVFFKQERVGKDGKIFKMWKFRTMAEGSDRVEKGHEIFENDPRITKLGKFLREWTIDESPQFVNIFLGDMSLVGPRPLPEYHVKNYNSFQKRVLLVKPGLVSMVDIKGRALVPWEKRFEYDNWYVDNQSLWLDFKILFLGFFAVLSRKGVYGESNEKNR